MLGSSLILLSLLSTSVRSDSTVTITLQGFVDVTCFATFQIAGDGQELDLTLDANDVLAADGTLFCNEPNGFTVSLTSANGAIEAVNSGIFLATTASTVTNRLPYNLKFETSDGASSSVSFVNGVASSLVQGTTGDAINQTFQMLVSFVGDTSLQSDNYTDELTLSIIAQ